MAHIADFLSKIQNSNNLQNNIIEALYEADLGALEKYITALFASIAYNNFTGTAILNLKFDH